MHAKNCTRCLETKPTDEFYFDKSKGRLVAACKVCCRAAMRPRCLAHYRKDPEPYRRRRRESSARAAKFVRQYKLANSRCMDCGLDHPPHRLDFDHCRGTKSANLSQASRHGWGEARIREEIAKCDLVCANCHRDRTEQRRA